MNFIIDCVQLQNLMKCLERKQTTQYINMVVNSSLKAVRAKVMMHVHPRSTHPEVLDLSEAYSYI